MDHEIAVWLNSEKDYFAGILLYDKYGRNPNQNRILRVGGATGNNRKTLIYELGKIAKHLTVSDFKPALVKLLEKQENKITELPVPLEVPTIEKLRSEQKMIYKMLDNSHAILPFGEIKKRKAIAFQILDLDDRLQQITGRIAHYEKHGVIPAEPIKDEPMKISELNKAELILRQNNVRTYITKYQRLVDDTTKLKSLSRNRELLGMYQKQMDEITERLSK